MTNGTPNNLESRIDRLETVLSSAGEFLLQASALAQQNTIAIDRLTERIYRNAIAIDRLTERATVLEQLFETQLADNRADRAEWNRRIDEERARADARYEANQEAIRALLARLTGG
jgi:hypothetical protein